MWRARGCSEVWGLARVVPSRVGESGEKLSVPSQKAGESGGGFPSPPQCQTRREQPSDVGAGDALLRSSVLQTPPKHDT